MEKYFDFESFSSRLSLPLSLSTSHEQTVRKYVDIRLLTTIGHWSVYSVFSRCMKAYVFQSKTELFFNSIILFKELLLVWVSKIALKTNKNECNLVEFCLRLMLNLTTLSKSPLCSCECCLCLVFIKLQLLHLSVERTDIRTMIDRCVCVGLSRWAHHFDWQLDTNSVLHKIATWCDPHGQVHLFRNAM